MFDHILKIVLHIFYLFFLYVGYKMLLNDNKTQNGYNNIKYIGDCLKPLYIIMIIISFIYMVIITCYELHIL